MYATECQSFVVVQIRVPHLQVDLEHMWFEHLNTSDEYTFIEPAIDLSLYFGSDEWDISRVAGRKNRVKYPCCKDPFSDITFYITVRRKTLFYTVNLLIPCIAINMLTYLTFYLPAECGEKISLSICTLLSLSLFQLLLLETMPPTSTKIPLLGKYILFTTIVVSLSVLSSVIVVNVQMRSKWLREMSPLTRKIFLQLVPRLLYMKRPETPASSAEQTASTAMDSAANQNGRSVNNITNTTSTTESLLRTEHQTGHQFTCYCNTHNPPAYRTCASRRRRTTTLPVNALKAIAGACYIANHVRLDSDTRVRDEWRYLAMVFDRILLIAYCVACVVGSCAILLNAPVLYDDTVAL